MQDSKECYRCGSKNLKFIPRPDTVHQGELRCSDCDKFWGWKKKDDNENRRTQTSKYNLHDIRKFYKKEKDFCWFCLRTKEQLGWNETLTIDHILELSKGGLDILENLQVLCSACHKLKNWARLYINWHFNKKEEGDEDNTGATKERRV